jgi:hypothetical protein
VTEEQYDAIGTWLESGRDVWLGVVPTIEPTESQPTGADLTTSVLAWWRALGFTDLERLPDTTVTPRCGLAGASPWWAKTALGFTTEVARNLSVEQGKMDA